MPTTVTVAAAVGSLAESAGNTAAFVATRDNTSGGMAVNFTLSGTATNGSDYSASAVVFFAPGQATANVMIDPTDDSTSEATETIVFTLNSGSGYTVGSPSSASIDILDNDAQVVTVAMLNDAVEDGTDGKFRFTRIGDLSGSLTANFSVGGTATSGTDFTSLGTTVVFAANSATADVTVEALHDGVQDADETVSVTVTSGSGYSVGSPSSDTLEIIDTDSDPVAFDGWDTTSVNTALEINVIDLATDLDGDELEVTGVTQGENGTVVNNEDGTVTYTPDTDFVGEDSFTYTVEDEFGNEATATITVTVTAPIAPPTSVWTDTDTPVEIDVLAMAFDPDEDELEVAAVTQGAYGTVVINLDGTITYTPNTSFTGDDEFTYTVEDPDGSEATNTITVTVGPIDPVALDDEVATAVNTAVNIDPEDIAFDPAGDTVEVIAVTQGAHGTVVIETDGTITYTPDSNWTGTDTFTYTVEDDDSNTSVGTITVVVGTPAPTDADAIIEDLEDMEDLLDNYDEETPDELLAALPGLLSSFGDYLEDYTTLISANNINVLGANKPLDEAAKISLIVCRAVYPAYTELLDLEASYWQLLELNKATIAGLKTSRTIAINQANAVVVAQTSFAIGTLTAIQFELLRVYAKIEAGLETTLATVEKARRMFRPPGFPVWLQGLFIAPPLPPVRILETVIP